MLYFLSLFFGYVKISFRNILIIFLVIFTGLQLASLIPTIDPKGGIIFAWFFLPASLWMMEGLSNIGIKLGNLLIHISFLLIAELSVLFILHYAGNRLANKTGNIHQL